MARKKSPRKAAKKSSKKSKKRTKRSTWKEPARKKPTRKDPTGWVALGLIIIVAALVWLAYQNIQASEPVSSGDVLVSVNGVEVTQGSLDFQYGLLPAEYRAQLSKEDVLEQVIDEELLVQDARGKGVEVTPEDINERIQRLLEQGGLTVSDLQLNLAQFNMSMDEFEALVERQILIARYTEDHISVEDPSEEELREIYDMSQDKFALPEQVMVRHVLVASQREDAATIAKDVYDQAREGEDFCELVLEWTDDVGSSDTCGEYTFPKGFMVPEFEEASFSLAPGEFEMVQTQFGYHIIEKLEDIEAGIIPFEDVEDQLRSEFRSASHLQAYKSITASLREDAVIVYGGEEQDEPEEEDSEAPAEAVEPAEDAAPEETESEETVEDTEMEQLVEEVKAELEEVVEEIAPVELEEEPEELEELAEDLEEAVAVHVEIDNVHACIADRATLFGMPWSSETRNAKELFEGYELDYVDCSQNECPGVIAYPSWGIDGEVVMGRLSIEDLQQLTGC